MEFSLSSPVTLSSTAVSPNPWSFPSASTSLWAATWATTATTTCSDWTTAECSDKKEVAEIIKREYNCNETEIN